MSKAGSSRTRARRAPTGAQHAFVGGWSQRRGDFVSLLLGVRQGRRRKLTYIGEVKTDPDDLAMTLLAPRLRESEIETSPFAEEPPAHRTIVITGSAPIWSRKSNSMAGHAMGHWAKLH